MTSAKSTILTAIHFKGTDHVRSNAATFADNALCSISYVLSIVRQVEKGNIKTQAA